MADLVILFFISFSAATILPVFSEVFLFTLNTSGEYNSLLLLLIATLGNVLGAVVNWVIGFYFLKLQDKKWFPLNKSQIALYTKQYNKWGKWSLLFSWMPVIGDPLTVVSGIFKTNIIHFITLVTIGKMTRYVLILLV